MQAAYRGLAASPRPRIKRRVSVLLTLMKSSELLESCFTLVDVERPDQPAIYVNERFKSLTGYGDEVLGRNFRFLQGPLTSPEARVRMRRAIAARQAIHQDLVNYKKSGEPFWNRMVLVPLVDVGHFYYFGIQLDVTDPKSREVGTPLTDLTPARVRSEEICHIIREPMRLLLRSHDQLEEADRGPIEIQRIVKNLASAVARIDEYVRDLPWTGEDVA